jgi:hypothetical protein
LRLGQPIEPVDHPCAELVERGERQLHLGLDTDGVHDRAVACCAAHVLEQRGLPDAGVAAQHEHATLPAPDPLEQLLELMALSRPPDQRGRGGHTECHRGESGASSHSRRSTTTMARGRRPICISIRPATNAMTSTSKISNAGPKTIIARIAEKTPSVVRNGPLEDELRSLRGACIINLRQPDLAVTAAS